MVAIPQRTLQTPLYGLLAALAGSNPELPGKWLLGVEWTPEQAAAGGTAGVVACELEGFEGEPAQPGPERFIPYAIWAADRCSTLDRGRDRGARARRNLDAVRSFLVEREFWNGDVARAEDEYAGNTFLAANGADVVSGAALSPTLGLACLEAAFAAFAPGQRAYIHAPVSVATLWFAAGAVEMQGNLMLTALRSIVIPGAGYTGDGPAAAPGGDPVPAGDGSVWAYATVAPEVRVGTVDTLEGEVPWTNDHVVRAWQPVAATVDGYARLAVELDLPHCAVGSPGSPPAGAAAVVPAYVHTQAVADDVWTITHNLGWNPNVQLTDDDGNDLDGNVNQVSTSQLTVTFAEAVAGKAYLS